MYRFIKFKKNIRLANIRFKYQNNEDVVFSFRNVEKGYVFQIPEFFDVKDFYVIDTENYYLEKVSKNFDNSINLLDRNGKLIIEDYTYINNLNIINFLISIAKGEIANTDISFEAEFNELVTEDFVYKYQGFLAYKGFSIYDLEKIFNKYVKATKFSDNSSDLVPFAMKYISKNSEYVELNVESLFKGGFYVEVHNEFNNLIYSGNLKEQKSQIFINVKECNGYLKFSSSLDELYYTIEEIEQLEETSLKCSNISYKFIDLKAKKTVVLFKNNIFNCFVKNDNIRKRVSSVNQLYIETSIYDLVMLDVDINEFLKQFAEENRLNITEIYLYGENDAANFLLKNRFIKDVKKIALYPIPNTIFTYKYNETYKIPGQYRNICYDFNLFDNDLINSEHEIIPYNGGNDYLTKTISKVEIVPIAKIVKYIRLPKKELRDFFIGSEKIKKLINKIR